MNNIEYKTVILDDELKYIHQRNIDMICKELSRDNWVLVSSTLDETKTKLILFFKKNVKSVQ